MYSKYLSSCDLPIACIIARGNGSPDFTAFSMSASVTVQKALLWFNTLYSMAIILLCVLL